MFNGTGANVVSLQSMLPRWGAVICTTTAHIHSTRTARRSGSAASSCCTVPTPDGKLTPELIDREAWGWGDEHRAQPLAVSASRRPPNWAPLYTVDEVRAIADHVHAHGMQLHMDGARISNAAACLGVPLRAFTTDAGVDVLELRRHQERRCLRRGGRRARPGGVATGLTYLRKFNMQLSSKMRFVSAQLIALLERRPVAAHRHRTPTRWPRGCAPARGGHRRRVDPGSRSPSRRRRTPSSRRCPTASPTGCASRSASTTGMPRRTRCAGCAPSTRPRPTSTRSSPRSKTALAGLNSPRLHASAPCRVRALRVRNSGTTFALDRGGQRLTDHRGHAERPGVGQVVLIAVDVRPADDAEAVGRVAVLVGEIEQRRARIARRDPDRVDILQHVLAGFDAIGGRTDAQALVRVGRRSRGCRRSSRSGRPWPASTPRRSRRRSPSADPARR